MVTMPKKINTLYETLPVETIEAIDKRDKK
jgi:hypothetical protein